MLLYLRDHAAETAATPAISLPELLQDTLGPQHGGDLSDWFERRLRQGDCVVLLDGLDEVGDSDSRRAFVAWVETQIRRYPNNDYVITSRPHGYRTAEIDGATVLQVRNFTSEQVNTFVRAWYFAVEKHSADGDGKDVLLRAETAADDLLERLSQAPALYELTVNPLLLTMIANVHRYRGALPGSRVRLYEEICQVMLWRRQEAKRLPIELGGDEKEALLRRLAYTMMRRRVRDLPRGQVIEVIRPSLQRMATTLTEDGFLADATSNGLLIERENDLLSFAHLTFQEYLASAHIRHHNLSRVLGKAVDDVWWRETTLLYAARSDTDPIVTACLRSGSLAALSLAFDCADQGSQLAPKLRRRLEELLDIALASDTDDAHRQLMIGVLINRRLRALIPANTGSRICATPVTTDLYRLFRQDKSVPAPDHANSTESKSGNGTKSRSDNESTSDVVTGVWGTDVVAFTHWVNGITRSDPVYRLPTHAELDYAVAHHALAVPTRGMPSSVWTTEDTDSSQPRLWLPAGTAHPHSVDGATVASQVESDIVRSTSTLARLMLLRSIVAARLLACGLNQLDEQDPRLTRDRAFDLAFDLAHTLRYVNVDGSYDVSHAHAQVRELDRHLVRAFDDRLKPAGVLDQVLAIGLERTGFLDRYPVADLDRAFQEGLDQVMGATLANALARVLRHSDPSSTWPVDLAQAFVRETNAATISYCVPPDNLAGTLRSGIDGLVTALATTETTAANWSRHVAQDVAEIGMPILERKQPLMKESATAIRLAALCLAADGESLQVSSATEELRKVAAGMTLLEGRATGVLPTTEMIFLTVT
jgi:hypothetical protein